MRVLITGVRGKTGAPLANLLAARGDVEILGGSGDPAALALDGVIPTRFSWDDPSGWASATAGIDAVYLVRPDRPDAPELVARLLAEMSAGARVVLLSEREPDSRRDDGWALRGEQAVRESGRPWTILRPSWFMQVFTDPRFYGEEIAERGRLSFPSGDARVAWIDARDIAAVAEHALLDEGHDEKIYELSGPVAMTLPETAACLTDALGRPVAHHEITIEEAVADMPDGFERDETRWTLERLQTGQFSEVTGTVELVTGRSPRGLEALVLP